MVFFAKGAQVLALLAFLVRVEARLLELVVRDGVLHTVDDELDALLDFGDLFRQRSLAQLYARPGFVDQVDGLVRKEAVRNIAVRMRYREVDGLVGVGDGVELLVAVFDSEQESWWHWPRPAAEPLRPGSAAPANDLSRSTCDTRPAWWRRCTESRRETAPASGCWRRRANLPPSLRRPGYAIRR